MGRMRSQTVPRDPGGTDVARQRDQCWHENFGERGQCFPSVDLARGKKVVFPTLPPEADLIPQLSLLTTGVLLEEFLVLRDE